MSKKAGEIPPNHVHLMVLFVEKTNESGCSIFGRSRKSSVIIVPNRSRRAPFLALSCIAVAHGEVPLYTTSFTGVATSRPFILYPYIAYIVHKKIYCTIFYNHCTYVYVYIYNHVYTECVYKYIYIEIHHIYRYILYNNILYYNINLLKGQGTM